MTNDELIARLIESQKSLGAKIDRICAKIDRICAPRRTSQIVYTPEEWQLIRRQMNLEMAERMKKLYHLR